jgi:hypothetical protein
MKHPHRFRHGFALALAVVLAPTAAWSLTWEDSVSAAPSAAAPDVPIDASETPTPPRPKPIPLPDETRRPTYDGSEDDTGRLPPTAIPVPSPYAMPAPPPSTATTDAPEYTFELVVRYGDLEGGTTTFAADHNALVTLVVDSDQVETVWVQDYNVGIAAQPGQPAMLKFRAERPGRFAIWYGSARHEIAVLEIGPPAPANTGPLPWSFP